MEKYEQDYKTEVGAERQNGSVFETVFGFSLRCFISFKMLVTLLPPQKNKKPPTENHENLQQLSRANM